MTDIEKWEVVEFLMTKLEPVNLESLGHDERNCTICQEEFLVCEDIKLSHPPVKLNCGHIFGKPCLIKWLDPLCYRGLEEDDQGSGDTHSDRYGQAKTDCPLCRQVLFPKCWVEPMEYLVQRLSFWDMAYAKLGVARSEKEERSRKYLWEYVEYCRSINDPSNIDGRLEYDMAQVYFLVFAINLVQTQSLTPEQEDLRIKMIEIAYKDLTVSPLEDGDGFLVVLTRVNDELQPTKTRRLVFRH